MSAAKALCTTAYYCKQATSPDGLATGL